MVAKSKKYNYVYKTTHIKTGLFYIGIRSCNCEIEDDYEYIGSGILISKFKNKYGLKSFIKTVLFNFSSRKEASDKEKEIVTNDLINTKMCLNLITGGDINEPKALSEQSNEKIKSSLREHYKDPNNRRRQSDKIKQAFIDDPTYRERLSIKRKETASKPEHKKLVSEIRKKLCSTPEYKEKMVTAQNKPETKLKKSNSLKKSSNTIKGKKRLSNATKGLVYVNKDNVTKRIKQNRLEEYIINGWNLGNGRITSSETSSKLSNISKGRVWFHNDAIKKNCRIKFYDVETFISNNPEWIKGWKKYEK